LAAEIHARQALLLAIAGHSDVGRTNAIWSIPRGQDITGEQSVHDVRLWRVAAVQHDAMEDRFAAKADMTGMAVKLKARAHPTPSFEGPHIVLPTFAACQV
jgi:hypothetical protein